MAEALMSTNDQPRLDASNAINKNQLSWGRRLARADGAPFFRGNFGIKDDGFVGGWLLDIIKRQLAPVVDLPRVELHHQIAKDRHTRI
jgi:hypothetical protein